MHKNLYSSNKKHHQSLIQIYIISMIQKSVIFKRLKMAIKTKHYIPNKQRYQNYVNRLKEQGGAIKKIYFEKEELEQIEQLKNKLMLSDKATVSDIVKAVILIASEGELYTSSGIVNISALTTINKA
uniref:Uncharacterized protein n=2 Tax=Yersinia TaxID=629 RepID=B0RKZ9_YEREN|nr:hypothetical protein [Yersinia enterocolitica]